MSAKKEDRWVGTMFLRQIGRYTLAAERETSGGWWWCVSDSRGPVATGPAPDEKTAKLKARLVVVDRCLRRDAKRGGR